MTETRKDDRRAAATAFKTDERAFYATTDTAVLRQQLASWRQLIDWGQDRTVISNVFAGACCSAAMIRMEMKARAAEAIVDGAAA